MSKLDDLIAKLCPDGVEYRPLLSVVNVLYGYPCNASLFNENKEGLPLVRIRDVLAGETCTFTTERVPDKYYLNRGDLLVGMDGNFHVANWNMDKGILCQRVCKFYSKDNNLLQDGFVSHWMKPVMKRVENGKQSGTVKHLLDKDIKALRIPVPPLEVQREIVRVLDNFTCLTAELTGELTAELQLRKKQYEYYRDKMLSYSTEVHEITILDMLSQPITDGPHETPTLVSSGIPFLSAEAIVDNRLDFNHIRGYITKEYDTVCAKKYKPLKNDVYMCKSGSTTGKVAINDTDIDFNIWSPLAAMRVNEKHSARYLFYLLQSKAMQDQVIMHASHGSQPNLSMRKLEQFKVTVPSLEVQERIVAVLDNFDAICSDMNIGLPAEIEARQKQYEYYRDKLLSFREKKS